MDLSQGIRPWYLGTKSEVNPLIMLFKNYPSFKSFNKSTEEAIDKPLACCMLYSIEENGLQQNLTEVTEAWNLGQYDLIVVWQFVTPQNESTDPVSWLYVVFNWRKWTQNWTEVTHAWNVCQCDLIVVWRFFTTQDESTGEVSWLYTVYNWKMDLKAKLNLSHWSIKCRSTWPYCCTTVLYQPRWIYWTDEVS